MKLFHRAAGLTAAILLAANLLAGSARAADPRQFTDISGHWAEAHLRQAVEEGLLTGESATTLNPNGPATLAQALTILCRILAPTGRVEMPELGDRWYRPYVEAAMTFGTQPDLAPLTDGVFTRGDAFTLIAESFRLIPALPDYTVLDAFPDAGDLTPRQRDAAAAMVKLGYLNGTGKGLSPRKGLTRAELVTMILRVAESTVSGETAPDGPDTALVLREAGGLSGKTYTKPVWIGFSAGEADLRGLRADTVVVLTGEADVLLDSSTAIRRLVLAGSRTGSVRIDSGAVDTLVIAPGGPVSVEIGGGVKNVELTRDAVNLTVSCALDALAVSGGNCTVSAGGRVGAASLSGSASGCSLALWWETGSLTVLGRNNRVILNANADRATLGGSGCSLLGVGRVSELTLTGRRSNAGVPATRREYAYPQGLGELEADLKAPRTVGIAGDLEAALELSNPAVEDVSVSWWMAGTVLKTQSVRVGSTKTACTLSCPVPSGNLSTPNQYLTAVITSRATGEQVTVFAPVILTGVEEALNNTTLELRDDGTAPGTLRAAAAITGDISVTASLTWYEGDTPVKTQLVRLKAGETQEVSFVHDPVYLTGEGLCPVRAELKFTCGRRSSAVSSRTVALAAGIPFEQALAAVSSTYRGDRTLQWALDHDYSNAMKLSFINAKGYRSATEYLIWVNRACQRVNVFRGAPGNWTLVKTFLCGTGAPGSATPVGEYTVWAFQKGWYHSYWVEPVVRFYDGTGYAFHTRLWNPGHKTLQDDRIGFPISAGCVRMYDEDCQWLYDNIPLRTKVVVF